MPWLEPDFGWVNRYSFILPSQFLLSLKYLNLVTSDETGKCNYNLRIIINKELKNGHDFNREPKFTMKETEKNAYDNDITNR